jgi:hypothetical protein
MSDLARIFDMPHETPEHQMLCQTAWMAGGSVMVPYFLGRLLGENLFRCERTAIAEKLRKFFVQRGWHKSAPLAANFSSWDTLGHLLEHYVQPRHHKGEPLQRLLAIEAFLLIPNATDQEIARQIGTTEKQVARVSALTWLRRLLRESSNGGATD